jgi:hypothetical protein
VAVVRWLGATAVIVAHPHGQSESDGSIVNVPLMSRYDAPDALVPEGGQTPADLVLSDEGIRGSSRHRTIGSTRTT